MRIDELLVAGGIVDAKAMDLAVRRQSVHGGSLFDLLVSAGAVTAEELQSFLDRVPPVPTSAADTGIGTTELLNLLMKNIYAGSLETRSEMIESIKLPPSVANELIDLAIAEQLLMTLGGVGAGGMADMRYAVSNRGKEWAVDALERSRYVGPAPVSLASFRDKAASQKLTNERLTVESIKAAFAGLTIQDSFLDQMGPAVNSGRAILLYGPPGNGKTSIAMRLKQAFRDVVYIPHAVSIDGHVMRVFDSSVHVPVVGANDTSQRVRRTLLADNFDSRWVACWRPFVVTGGELTLEMLDLRYDPNSNHYEAPLHIKATGGCLLIDDFGRQLVSPRTLLNRWIIPLENRVDYLKLHTGMSFSLPFETLVIFSTNYEPADLMDQAFLRRIPYKIPVRGPSPEDFRRIFEAEAAARDMDLPHDVVGFVMDRLTREHALQLAAYQPRFIIEQVAAACTFRQQAPHFERALLDYAIANLSVERSAEMQAIDAAHPMIDEAPGAARHSGTPAEVHTLDPASHRGLRLKSA